MKMKTEYGPEPMNKHCETDGRKSDAKMIENLLRKCSNNYYEGGHCGATPIFFLFCWAAEDFKKTQVPQVKKVYARFVCCVVSLIFLAKQ